MPTFDEITRHGDLDPDIEWVGRPLPLEPIAVVDPDPRWARQFDALAGRIRSTLGVRVLDLLHAGSTSVSDLPAKPVIDICLTVEDSGDEAAYVPALERIGFCTLDPRARLASTPLSRGDVTTSDPSRWELRQPGGDPESHVSRLATRTS